MPDHRRVLTPPPAFDPPPTFGVPSAFAPVSQEIGGYRVVRTLAAGRHGVRLLVHAEGRSWVARVFHRECPDELIDHDLAVSDAVRGALGELSTHVSVVHDLSTTDDGRVVLIEEHLAGPRLDALVGRRGALVALGEVVTVLAPLVTVVEQAHRAGLTGLLPDASAVRLRASGAPVITRRLSARVGPALPDRFRDREPQYAADREALERVGMALGSALAQEDQQALLSVFRRRGVNLEHALFDLAPPEPVRLADDVSALPDAGMSRSTSAIAAAAPGPPSGEAFGEPDGSPAWVDRVRRALTSTLQTLGLPPVVIDTVSTAVDTAAARTDGIARLLRRITPTGSRTVRPRFALAGIGGAGALVGAIALTSLAGATTADAESTVTATSASDASTSTPGARDGDNAQPGAPGLAETELHPEPVTWPLLVEELVDRWIACAPLASGAQNLDDGAPQAVNGPQQHECGAAVVHEGSAAAALLTVEDDRHHHLRQWRAARGETVVVERMGAAVLVDLVDDSMTTASLLVVRSEAGWRIRDVLAAAQ